jgi:hypothetical protein
MKDVVFDKWDCDENGEYDEKDVYSVDGRTVPFEQWLDLTNWNRSWGPSDSVIWMDYSGWFVSELK